MKVYGKEATSAGDLTLIGRAARRNLKNEAQCGEGSG